LGKKNSTDFGKRKAEHINLTKYPSLSYHNNQAWKMKSDIMLKSLIGARLIFTLISDRP